MDWKPTEQGINALMNVLTQIQAPDTNTQTQALTMSVELQKHPEFSAYAGYVFCNPNNSKNVRMQAGLLLKNYIYNNKDKMDEKIFNIAKNYVAQAILDRFKEIRRTAANIVASIIRMTFQHYDMSIGQIQDISGQVFEDWPNLLSELITTLERNAQTALTDSSNKSYLVEGPLLVIELLLLDCGTAVVESQECGELFKALMFFADPTKKYSINTKNRALKSLHHMYAHQPPCITQNIEKFVQLIISSMDDSDIIIRRNIVTLTIITMNEFWHYFHKSTPKVFEFMLKSTNDSDEEIAIEAGEFWCLYLSILDRKYIDIQYFISFLPQLCPVLLKRLRLTEDMIAQMNLENDSQNKEDLSEDIEPKHYKGTKSNISTTNHSEKENNTNSYKNEMNDDNSSEISDSDVLAGNDSEERHHRRLSHNKTNHLLNLTTGNSLEWDIRRCCARQMDMLASRDEKEIREGLLKCLLPMIKNYLDSSDPLNREAGVLALGTLVGFKLDYKGLDVLLNDLMQSLYQCIQDKNLLLRSITCWTLSRFARMFVDAVRSGAIESKNLQNMIETLLRCMTDDSKRVQKAACGAMASFTPFIRDYLRLWIKPIMGTFVQAFNNYKLSTFPHLMDVVTQVISNMNDYEVYELSRLHMLVVSTRNSSNEEFAQFARTAGLNGVNSKEEFIQKCLNDIEAMKATSVCSNEVIDALIPPLMKRWIMFEKEEEEEDVDGGGSGSNGDGEDEFLSTKYDDNIYPVFEGLTQFINIFGKTKYFQEKYLKEIFIKALMLCVRLKQEVREWTQMKEEAKKELFSNDSNNSNNSNNESNSNDKSEMASGRSEKRYMNGSTVIVETKNVDEQVIMDHIGKDAPNYELWTCGLDALSVLCENCTNKPTDNTTDNNNNNDNSKPLFEQIAFSTQYESLLLEMIWCAIDNNEFFTVRRNSLALLGDLISHCPNSMYPHCPKFLEMVIKLITPTGGHVSTNASWTIGQALYRYDKNMQQWAEMIMDQLRSVLKDANSHEFVVTNVAITMGRLIQIFHETLIKDWNTFAIEWINALSKFKQDSDKVECMKTLLSTVDVNVQGLLNASDEQGGGGVVKGVQALFGCMMNWQQPVDPQLYVMFVKTVARFKFGLGNEKWDKVMAEMSQGVAQWAQQMIGIWQQQQQMQGQQQQQGQVQG